MTYLFLGGVADGRRISIPDNEPRVWRVAIPVPFYGNHVGMSMLEEEYYRITLARKDGSWTYVYASQDCGDVLDRLIAGYASKKEDKN